MDTTIGTSQTGRSLTSGATTSAQVLYLTRFCSSPLAAQTISADTWTWTFAYSQSSSSARFPCSNSASQIINVTFYAWRPSTGAKVGNIRDGGSNGTYSGSSLTSERSATGTFAGSAITVAAGDILCFETILSVTQGSATAFTDEYFYDGSVETNSNGTSTSNQASYVSNTITTIAFGGAAAPVFLDWAPMTMLVTTGV